jgi:hypothetical protein
MREDELRNGVGALARALEALPGIDATTDEQLRKEYEESARGPMRALIESLALAKRTRRPLFSDDRWIREFARYIGVPAFGSLALLDALDATSTLEPGQHFAARLRLAGARGWGLAFSGDELVRAAAESDWKLSEPLIGALNDRAAWRGRPADTFNAMIPLLDRAHADAPDRFERWLHRVLDAGHAAVPHMRRSWFAQALLVMAWDVGVDQPRVSKEAFHRLVRELHRLPFWLTDPGADPVMAALNDITQLIAGENEGVRYALFLHAIQRLPSLDQLRAWLRFVRVTG